jgi:peroxiredoxin
MEVNVGEKAPLFSLFNDDRSKVALEALRGKNVILVFFPLAFSSVCTKELCTLRDDLKTYTQIDAQVLAISVDSVHTLHEFKKMHGLNFPLLSDFNKEVARAYGALHESFALEMKGVAKRSIFLIDKSGEIRYKEVMESPGTIPDFEAMQSVLSKLD